MFNKFWDKKKLAAYGILGNTGQVGLGWGDKDKYGQSSYQVTDDGGIYFWVSRIADSNVEIEIVTFDAGLLKCGDLIL